MRVHKANIVTGTHYQDAARKAGISLDKSGEYGEGSEDDSVAWEGWYYSHLALGEGADVYESPEDAAKAGLEALAAWLAGVLK